ncbi:MAG TPA: hypothetical protein VFV99_19585 [Kofleriaceae bacterium]|nr:hypothetical protein [Kofleriaceae bacterium]
MKVYRSFALALVLAVTGAAVASADPSSDESAAKSKKKSSKSSKKKTTSKKPAKKRTSHHSRKRTKTPKPIPGVPQDTDVTPVTDPGAPDPSSDTAATDAAATDAATSAPTDPVATEPAIAPTDPTQVDLDNASTPEVTADATAPEPPPPKPAATVTATVTPTPKPARRGPTWYVGLRGGPSVIDRRGYYEYSSNRQIYATERNVRLDLVFGRYLSRHISLGLALGTGPYPKFDAPDPAYDENTRFEVFPAHARLDVALHAGPFVVGVGAGGAYEQATGTFGVQDPDTFLVTMHTARFKRYGAMGTVDTGFQFQLGPLGLELLAEASAVKLMRGTYEHGITTAGPSDREMCYEASLLLGVRLQ